MTDATSLKLYRHPLSGNSHRVQLFLNLLGVPHELVEVDLMAGEQKTAAFRALNPKGQVPVLVDDGIVLSESNAILTYLAAKFDDGTWLPNDPLSAGKIQFWLSRTVTDVANGPGAARLVTLFGASLDHARAKEVGHTLLAELDRTLEHDSYLVGNRPTIADIAVYTYIAHAPEGGVTLDAYPNVRHWIDRIEALPGFIAMQRSALPEAA